MSISQMSTYPPIPNRYANFASLPTNANQGDIATTLVNPSVLYVYDTIAGWQAEGSGGGTITLTGQVTGSGTTSITTTIANNTVTNAELAQIPADSVIGNATGSTANASYIPFTQLATVSTIVGRDVNGNSNFINSIDGYTTTVTSGGTTTLTVGSTYQQYFTGSSNQTIILPVTSTLTLGQQFQIVNSGSGTLTLESSGGNSFGGGLLPSTSVIFTCILTSGTDTSSWNFQLSNQANGTVTSVQVSGSSTGLTFTGGPITTNGTINLGGTLAVTNGGTGLTALSTGPTANTFANWDVNSCISGNNVIDFLQQTVTSGITHTLTSTSYGQQVFTGTHSDIVQLPVANTLLLGTAYVLFNQSSGTITVNSSGGNQVLILQPTTVANIFCILSSGTTAASWTYDYSPIPTSTLTSTGSGSVVLATSPTLVTPNLGTPSALTLTNASGLSLTTGVSGILPIANGGTNSSSVTTAPTATTFAGWDANSNLSAKNFIEGFTSTATAAGTTTLVVGSTYTQYFTGSSTQIVKLPTTSIVAGQQYLIENRSTGLVTVQSSGANTIQIMSSNTSLLATALVATPTTAANWDVVYSAQTSIYPTNTQSGTSYSVLLSDYGKLIRLTSTSARAITMPTTPPDGFYVEIVDSSGSAYTANITMTCGGSDKFNIGTASTRVISSEYACETYIYNSSAALWEIE
jgi:hypothetical protein